MDSFYMRFKPSPDTVKLIISISKKVSKKAVTRNTIKRRVRAVMRELIKFLKPGTYFIVAKPGADKVKGVKLTEKLKSLFVSYEL